jgi:uncharacterized protein YjdB
MNQARSLILFLFVTMIFFSTMVHSTMAHAVTGQVTTTNTYASGVLVKFKSTITANSLNNTFSTAGCTASQWFQIVPGLAYAQIQPNSTLQQTLQSLQQDPNVEYAEPNYLVRAMETFPDDPDFDSLYGLHNTGQSSGVIDADIDAPQAWDLQTGSDVVIAVIDSGVDYNHEDLRDNMWTNPGEIPNNGLDDDGNGFVDDYRGWDFANNDNDPMDDHFHGTHVAGTIAAVGNNGIGVTGVNWKAKIMPLKFLGGDGSGSLQAAIGAIEYAAKMGARVSNNSWGGGPFSQALRDAIVNAENQGHLFVAAAGNDGANNDFQPSYPATYNVPNIISVAATDNRDNLASFSNYGASTVHLGAPGVNIFSTTPGNSYRLLSGTSMATPHVTGVAGLLFAANPALTYQEVKAAILDNVDPVASLNGRTITKGRLNAFKALDSLQGTLQITPPSAQVARGATLQFNAAGGTPPYAWSVDDPGIGSININGLFLGLTAGVTAITVADSASLTGTSGAVEVTQTSVTPATARLAPGQNLQFQATGGTAPYTWSSSNPTAAVINNNGVLTAQQEGTTTVTAVDANGVADTTGNIDIVLASLSIAPDNAVISVGGTVQFTTTNGSAPYTWSSTDPSVASINNAGLLTALAAGTTTVNVVDNNGDWGVSGVIEVRNISVEPRSASLNPGATLQFSASGGVPPYSWEVSNTQIASIDNSGLLTGLAGGTVTVTAIDTDGARGISGTITVNGNSTPQIQPGNVLLQLGGQLQLTVSGGFPPYLWSSSNPFVATIGQSNGLLSAVGTGFSFVQVRDVRGNLAQALVQVKNIQVFPPQSLTINAGEYLQFTATGGRFPYTWSVSDSSVASISNTGFLVGLSAGAVTVSAIDADGLEGISGTITIAGNTPPPPPSNPVTIAPDTGTVAIGTTLQFSVTGGTPPYQWGISNPFIARINTNGVLTGLATGTLSVAVRDANGATDQSGLISIVAASSPLRLTPLTANLQVGQGLQFTASGGASPYIWRVSNPFVATISATGVLTATAAGSTMVTVTDNNGVTASSGNIFILGGTTPQRLSVSPTTAQLVVGETLQFTAAGGTPPYTWLSINTAAGRIDANGLFTAQGAGITSIQVRDAIGATASTSFVQVSPSSSAQGESDAGNDTTDSSANNTGESAGGGSTSLLLIMLLLAFFAFRVRKHLI